MFGQFVDHDSGLEVTPPTTPPLNILVLAGDPMFTAGTEIAMNRDVRDPVTNNIINSVAGYLDLSQLYGSTDNVANSLRSPGGTLASSDEGQSPPIVQSAYAFGDPRGAENPELTAAIVLFARNHNYWVKRLKSQHPDWTGDQIYGRLARRGPLLLVERGF